MTESQTSTTQAIPAFLSSRVYYGSLAVVDSSKLPDGLDHMNPYVSTTDRDGLPTDNSTLLDYYSDRAVRTADDQGRKLGYLIPGMVSEYGEVIGKYAKSFWHQNWGIGEREYELALEFGDIMWMVAGVYTTLDPNTGHVSYPENATLYIANPRRRAIQEASALKRAEEGNSDISPRTRLKNLGHRILRLQELFDASIGDEDPRLPFEYLNPSALHPFHAITISEQLLDVWVSLLSTTAALTGVNPLWVMEMNLQKLESRADRGTLIGNGDHR